MKTPNAPTIYSDDAGMTQDSKEWKSQYTLRLLSFYERIRMQNRKYAEEITMPPHAEGKRNVYGDGAIYVMRKEGLRAIGRGHLDQLHEIYRYALTNGAAPLENNHPLKVHQRVLNALDRDKRFEKRFIDYRGIINRPCRIFYLKEVLVL